MRPCAHLLRTLSRPLQRKTENLNDIETVGVLNLKAVEGLRKEIIKLKLKIEI